MKMRTIKNLLTIGFPFLAFLLISGCMTAAQHQQSLPTAKEREMTLGIVQKEIRVGMSQADVATSLGSPNIVTKDSNGKETWVYDKIATEASYSKTHGYGTILVLGFSRDTGAASTTQKTLTVVIKFNEKNLVESFSYHASKF
jgi:outer membrane protein assembly factor BamE (lipoprotein component of BamABCDE complex)